LKGEPESALLKKESKKIQKPKIELALKTWS
jgi:hypothetical protein